MYDFYPEWGPARHRDEDLSAPHRRPRYWQDAPRAEAGEARMDSPDDN